MFGLGAGSIAINIPKTAYNAGEEIAGTLELDVRKPVKARGLFLKFYAEQEFREMRHQGGSGKMEPVDTKRRLYEYQLELDQEREYAKTNGAVAYPFSLAVPAGAPSGRAKDKP